MRIVVQDLLDLDGIAQALVSLDKIVAPIVLTMSLNAYVPTCNTTSIQIS